MLLWYFSVVLQTDVIYQFGEEFIASWPTWLGFFFCISSFWHIDYMLHALRQTMAYCFFTDSVKETPSETPMGSIKNS